MRACTVCSPPALLLLLVVLFLVAAWLLLVVSYCWFCWLALPVHLLACLVVAGRCYLVLAVYCYCCSPLAQPISLPYPRCPTLLSTSASKNLNRKSLL